MNRLIDPNELREIIEGLIGEIESFLEKRPYVPELSVRENILSAFGGSVEITNMELHEIFEKMVRKGVPFDPSNFPQYIEEMQSSSDLLNLACLPMEISSRELFQIVKERFDRVETSPRPRLWIYPTKTRQQILIGLGEPSVIRSVVKDIVRAIQLQS